MNFWNVIAHRGTAIVDELDVSMQLEKDGGPVNSRRKHRLVHRVEPKGLFVCPLGDGSYSDKQAAACQLLFAVRPVLEPEKKEKEHEKVMPLPQPMCQRSRRAVSHVARCFGSQIRRSCSFYRREHVR